MKKKRKKGGRGRGRKDKRHTSEKLAEREKIENRIKNSVSRWTKI